MNLTIKEQLEKNGCIEIDSEIYIATKEWMLAEQASWPNGDLAKYVDFTKDDFWVLSNDGESAHGCESFVNAMKKALQML